MTRKPVMHLIITDQRNRNCKYCCNKQYDVKNIPFATREEFESVDTVCLTGGEPFKYEEPCWIAGGLKSNYPNIKNIYVYTNAVELLEYLHEEDKFPLECSEFSNLDGLSVSIKNLMDLQAFQELVYHPLIRRLKSNLLYVFDNLLPEYVGNFKVIHREWQEDFKPAQNTIFRRLGGI